MNNDYNEVFERLEDEMIDAGKASTTPKQAKGGVFAPSDIDLIKRAVSFYVNKSLIIEDWEQRQISNLLHRLNNRI